MAGLWAEWVHATWSTHGHWLRGDERGFRDRDHRIHSSGTYHNPPPSEEHQGLREWTKHAIRQPVVLLKEVQPLMADSVVRKCTQLDIPLKVLAVAPTHVHALMFAGADDAKPVVGKLKQFASHQVRHRMPGKIWSDGCHIVRIRDEEHFLSVIRYIHRHRDEDAYVWESTGAC